MASGAARSRGSTRLEPPDGVRVLDGGTLGLVAAAYLEDADDVILVDAIRADAPAGRSSGWKATTCAGGCHRLSPHQVGVADLLDGRAGASGTRAASCCSAWCREPRARRRASPAVEAALPDLVERGRRRSTRLGICSPADRTMTRAARALRDVARALGL